MQYPDIDFDGNLPKDTSSSFIQDFANLQNSQDL